MMKIKNLYLVYLAAIVVLILLGVWAFSINLDIISIEDKLLDFDKLKTVGGRGCL